MRLFGKISSMAGNLKVVELRLCLFRVDSQTCVTLGKWQGDHYIQGDRYIHKATENFGKLYGDCDIQGSRSYKAVYTGLTVSCFKVLRP